MFGLSRLLELADQFTWWLNRGSRRCLALRRPAIRRAAPRLEELEERLVPTLLNQQLFPADYPWNQNIANAPVVSNSSAITAHIGSGIGIHPDWGNDSASNGNAALYGIPYNVVHGNTTTKINVVIDNYPGESDIISVPIPANAVVEGDYQNGPNLNGGGYNNGQRGDSHLIVWDEDTNTAYELYGVTRPSDPTLFPNTSGVELAHTDGRWHAAQESVWNMSADSFRALGDTSADAAGLSILAGLVRPDEGRPTTQSGQGVINHALRFTLPSGDVSNQYIYPASHMVNDSPGSTKLPFGARLRLQNTPAVNTLINGMGPEAQVIAHAMQQYGLVVADIGTAMYVTGTSASMDANNNISLTWNMNDVLGLHSLTASMFDVVDLTPQVTGLSATTGSAGTTITITGQNFSGAAGHLKVLFGSTAATQVTYVDDSHLTAVVPAGTGTVHVTVQSGVNATDPNSPNNNVKAPVFGYGTSTATTADQFTFGIPQTISAANSTASFATSTVASGNGDVLTIVVKDTSGNAVNGLASNAFLLNLAGGSSAGTFGTLTATATAGTYTTTFTGSTAGTASTLSVTVNGVSLTSQPTISVTVGAVSGANSTVSFASSTVTASGTDIVTMVVKDAGGNAISGLTNSAFAFSLANGTSAGTFGTVSATATAGTYTATFTASATAGTASSLTATVNSATLTAHPTVTVTPGGVSGITSTVSFAVNSVSVGGANIVTIVVKDAGGNAISGLASSAFNFSLSGGTSAGTFGAVSATATAGTYTATFTGSTAGTASSLTATVSGVTLSTQPTVTVTPVTISGANSTVNFGAPAVAPGSTVQLTLVVKDTSGNTISGLPSSAFAFSLAGGTSAGTFGSVTATATAGTYTATFTAGATAGTPSTLTATINGVTLAMQPTITVNIGPSGIIATNVPTFTWTAAAPGSVYKFWLTDQTTGQNVIVPNLTVTSWTPTQPLTLGDSYIWWIGVMQGQTANWNSGLTFRIAPTASGPTGNIATNMPAFNWNTVTGAASYEIWLTDQTTGQTTIAPNLTGTSWTPAQPLKLGDNYTWWAGAMQGQTITWSSSLTFKIAPTASGPSGTIATNVPVFAWNTITGAASYEVWLTDQTTGQVTIAPNLTGTSWTPTQPLTLGDNYTWWAGAIQGQVTSWSSAVNFRIAPTANGPSGTIATTLPAFGWTNVTGATAYEIWLTDQTTGQVTIAPNLTSASWTPAQPLTLGHNYTWWAGAMQGQSIIWSSAVNFRIAPTASGPTGNIASSLPTFAWNAVAGAASYEIWLTDQITGQNVIAANLTGTTWTPTQALVTGHNYIWWAGAVDATGLIGWSSSLTFTVTG